MFVLGSIKGKIDKQLQGWRDA